MLNILISLVPFGILVTFIISVFLGVHTFRIFIRIIGGVLIIPIILITLATLPVPCYPRVSFRMRTVPNDLDSCQRSDGDPESTRASKSQPGPFNYNFLRELPTGAGLMPPAAHISAWSSRGSPMLECLAFRLWLFAVYVCATVSRDPFKAS